MNKRISTFVSIRNYKFFYTLLLPAIVSCSFSAKSTQKEVERSPQTIHEELLNNEKEKINGKFRPIQSALNQMNLNNVQADNSQFNETLTDEEILRQAQLKQETSNKTSKLANDYNEKKAIDVDITAMNMGMPKHQSMKSKMTKNMCMGKMCKMMMRGQSMMGAKPTQKMPPELKDNTEILPSHENAPHLYHLGEPDFFLDQKERLSMSEAQVNALKNVKHQWKVLQRDNINTREKLESKLWELTSLAAPDLNLIKKTIDDIEKINTSLRISFIKFVGRSTEVLTHQQISVLTEGKNENVF